ncbi:MAG: methyltransferase type 11 [Butyrivibrio sp.]|nr:methyltransferase type 11 [Butyrivibrio sp.]
MINPWEEISLSDYENHMKLDSVMQLQNMNQMMESQLNDYPARSVMILGIAGGNGLEHINRNKFQTVYGIDINGKYLETVKERYTDISDILECLQLNLLEETDKLPKAELLIANLLIEYIGYDCFQKTVKQVQPEYVSCIIQINAGDSWVSDSPYIHAFDYLGKVHHPIDENSLIQSMKNIGYKKIAQTEKPLPNGKKLVQLDFIMEKQVCRRLLSDMEK